MAQQLRAYNRATYLKSELAHMTQVAVPTRSHTCATKQPDLAHSRQLSKLGLKLGERVKCKMVGGEGKPNVASTLCYLTC